MSLLNSTTTPWWAKGGREEERREEERREEEREERRRLLFQHPGYLLVRVLTFDLHLVEEAAVKNLVVIVGDTHIAHLCMHLQVPTSIVATNSILPPPPHHPSLIMFHISTLLHPYLFYLSTSFLPLHPSL